MSLSTVLPYLILILVNFVLYWIFRSVCTSKYLVYGVFVFVGLAFGYVWHLYIRKTQIQ